MLFTEKKNVKVDKLYFWIYGHYCELFLFLVILGARLINSKRILVHKL